jgi:hypothetical protein
MSLAYPNDYDDRALVWYGYHDRIRREEIRNLIDDELIAEHEANPIGYRQFHSPRLQRVLNYFRTQPVLGKYFVYATEPWEEYRIAIVRERGQPPDILEEPIFGSEEQAMHGVFLRRVADLAGRTG